MKRQPVTSEVSNETETSDFAKPRLCAVATGKPIDEVIADLCKPQSPKLWGQTHAEFTPRVCEKKLGDGLQLIWFQTSGQRPYWWWVFVDSKWNMSDEDYSLQVYDLIEEEFGSIPDEDDEDYADHYDDVEACYPMIVKNDGIMFGTQEFFSHCT